MGEAKRRKQALGKRYGQTPPVLVKGSGALEKQVRKFADAYFEKLDQLSDANSEEPQLEDEHEATIAEIQQQQDTLILDMRQWVQEYLEPYRPQDREQLVTGLLKPFFFALFKASPEFLKKNSEDGQDAYTSSLTGMLMGLTVLRPHLSEAKLEEYTDPLRELYRDMLDTLEEGATDIDTFTNQANILTQLFQACFNEEDRLPEFVSS